MSSSKYQSSIDIGAINEATRRKWIAENRPKVGLLDHVESSVPWWLVIVAATMFLLSAPHTASTFNRLTPGFGWVAPLGVEFGLLYAAFYRMTNGRSTKLNTTLERLLFVTSILVNGAGSLTAVVTSAGLQNKSIGDMLAGFWLLSASDQVLLALVIAAAFIVPIGTTVAGHGLAEFVMGRNRGKTASEEAEKALEAQWNEAKGGILREAYFAELIKANWTPGKAKTQATKLASIAGMAESPESAGIADDHGQTADKKAFGKGEAVQRLEQLRSEVPGFVHLPANKQIEISGVGKSVVYEWRKPYNNGHSHDTAVQ